MSRATGSKQEIYTIKRHRCVRLGRVVLYSHKRHNGREEAGRERSKCEPRRRRSVACSWSQPGLVHTIKVHVNVNH